MTPELTGLVRRLRNPAGWSMADVREAADAIEALATAPEWQPIAAAPRDGRAILAVWFNKVSGDPDFGVIRFERGDWVEYSSIVSEPASWMPLPTPPVTP